MMNERREEVRELVRAALRVGKDGLGKHFTSPLMLVDSWRRANDWHWARLAILAAQAMPDAETRRLVLEELVSHANSSATN